MDESPKHSKQKENHTEKLGRKSQKAFDTFLRNSYRTHTSLSALADRKANILIRFNSILISILLIFFREIIDINPTILYSIIVFLVTSLISLGFATLAARPEVTRFSKQGIKLNKEQQDHLFFFGNFVELSYDQYKAGVQQMMTDTQAIYDSMIRDIYNLGQVLDVKFKYIKWSYNVFMIGLTITVLSFMFSFLFMQ